jgi:hypothetical protein
MNIQRKQHWQFVRLITEEFWNQLTQLQKLTKYLAISFCTSEGSTSLKLSMGCPMNCLLLNRSVFNDCTTVMMLA